MTVAGYRVRYVLVIRSEDGTKLGTLSTDRHLWQLRQLHLSLFRQFAVAQVIDVVSWPYLGAIEEQEPVVSARRAVELEGGIVWRLQRDLKELEQELEQGQTEVQL